VADDRRSAPVACLWQDADVSLGFLASVVDHVAHPVFVKDRQFRWVLLNRALEQLVGYRREQMLGKTDHEFFPKAEADFFRAKDEELFRTQLAVVIDEEPITDASGQAHVLATTKVPMRGPDGQITHLVGIIKDITDLKRAESALRQAKLDSEELVRKRTDELRAAQDELVRKERLAALGQLAGGVAHQIRNPLAVMKNVASILRGAAARVGDAEIASAVGVIDDEVRHANQIVTDLLDYARVRPVTARLTAVGYAVEQALGALAIPETVTLRKNVPADLDAFFDADQLQAALHNVLRNALEAMPDGGTLTIGARVEGPDALVVIDDTGTGIPAAVQPRLFEPLVTSKPRGLGLGLTTARALIENQRGRIDWAPLEGGGTRFEVRLPRAR